MELGGGVGWLELGHGGIILLLWISALLCRPLWEDRKGQVSRLEVPLAHHMFVILYLGDVSVGSSGRLPAPFMAQNTAGEKRQLKIVGGGCEMWNSRLREAT